MANALTAPKSNHIVTMLPSFKAVMSELLPFFPVGNCWRAKCEKKLIFFERAVYVLLLPAVCVIPFALAQRNATRVARTSEVKASALSDLVQRSSNAHPVRP